MIHLYALLQYKMNGLKAEHEHLIAYMSSFDLWLVELACWHICVISMAVVSESEHLRAQESLKNRKTSVHWCSWREISSPAHHENVIKREFEGDNGQEQITGANKEVQGEQKIAPKKNLRLETNCYQIDGMQNKTGLIQSDILCMGSIRRIWWETGHTSHQEGHVEPLWQIPHDQESPLFWQFCWPVWKSIHRPLSPFPRFDLTFSIWHAEANSCKIHAAIFFLTCPASNGRAASLELFCFIHHSRHSKCSYYHSRRRPVSVYRAVILFF